MLSFPNISNEIMVLVASFDSILNGKSANSSTSFHQWKYVYQIFERSHYIETVNIAKTTKMRSLHATKKWSSLIKMKKI